MITIPRALPIIPYTVPRGVCGLCRAVARSEACSSYLLEDRLGAGVSLDRGRLADLLEQLDVLADDVELARDAVVQVVLAGELLQHLRHRRVLVPRHRREDVVLELPLHAAPQDVREGVVALGVARR